MRPPPGLSGLPVPNAMLLASYSCPASVPELKAASPPLHYRLLELYRLYTDKNPSWRHDRVRYLSGGFVPHKSFFCLKFNYSFMFRNIRDFVKFLALPRKFLYSLRQLARETAVSPSERARLHACEKLPSPPGSCFWRNTRQMYTMGGGGGNLGH